MTGEEAKKILRKLLAEDEDIDFFSYDEKEAVNHFAYLPENKGEWIPVTERLPEPEDKQEVKVIVSYENEDGEFVEKGVFNKRYGFNFPSVKAWQPLPEPYKPEQEEGAE